MKQFVLFRVHADADYIQNISISLLREISLGSLHTKLSPSCLALYINNRYYVSLELAARLLFNTIYPHSISSEEHLRFGSDVNTLHIYSYLSTKIPR
jgi:hypothetical protein